MTELRLKLLTGEELLAELFPHEATRPSMKWLESLTEAGVVPSLKIAGLRRYDLERVVRALNAMEETKRQRRESRTSLTSPCISARQETQMPGIEAHPRPRRLHER